MSAPGARPGQQGWTWSESLRDYYWRNPSTGQYFLHSGGNPKPIATAPSQSPRSEQHMSDSAVRDTSQPNRTGSPIDEAAEYTLLSRPRRPTSLSLVGHSQTASRSGSQSTSQIGPSTDSTRPSSGTFSSSSPDAIQRDRESQTSTHVAEDTNKSELQPRDSRTAGTISPFTAKSGLPTNSYLTQAPSFVPGSSSVSGIPFSLDQQMSGLSVGPGQSRSDRTGSESVESSLYVDEDSGLRGIVQSGNVVTDPSLRQYGITAHKHLLGTVGENEVLYPDFRKRAKPRNFFTVGKVFMILWAEPAGDSGQSNTLITSQQQSTYPGRYGELVFSKVRRFIVIRESENYCSALSIVSYGSQGAGKPGVVKHEHGIVYTGKQPPDPSPNELPRRGEMGMVPTAVRVDPDQRTEKLNPMCRINYGKVYTVEHNVKVKPLGTVGRDSLHALIYQFKAVWNPGFPRQRGMTSAPEPETSKVQQHVPARGQDNYSAAFQYLTSQGWVPEQAEAALKQKRKTHATEKNTARTGRGESTSSSDEDEEIADVKSDSDAQMRRAVRHLHKYSGLSLEKATAVVKRQRKKHLKAKGQTGDDADEKPGPGNSDTNGEKQKDLEKKTLDEARNRQFHNAVNALHQQGVSYEEAYRSVHASMTRGRGKAAASASQRGSTGQPRRSEGDESEEDSTDESSECHEEEA